MCPRGYCGAGERRDEGRGGGPEEESGRVDGARGERRAKVEEEVQLAARERVEEVERVEAAERGATSTAPTSGQGSLLNLLCFAQLEPNRDPQNTII